MFSRHGIKYAYFVSLSITTYIKSYFRFVPGFFDLGSLIIKSIIMFSHVPAGAELGRNFP
jgi:hypothetical protein